MSTLKNGLGVTLRISSEYGATNFLYKLLSTIRQIVNIFKSFSNPHQLM